MSLTIHSTTTASCADAPQPRNWRRFTLHYLEMVAAMIVGMIALGLAQDGLLAATGAEAVSGALDGPLVGSVLMTAYMVVGMGGWMAYRGHSLRSNVEMNAAMVAPLPVLLVLQ